MTLIDKFKEFVNDLFTGPDKQTYSMTKYLIFVTVHFLFAIQIYAIIHGQKFDPVQFGIAAGAIFGAGGVARKLNPPSQPGDN